MYLDFLFSQSSVLQTHSCKISYITKNNYSETSIVLILTSKFHIEKNTCPCNQDSIFKFLWIKGWPKIVLMQNKEVEAMLTCTKLTFNSAFILINNPK
jgi:hypothetical protein